MSTESEYCVTACAPELCPSNSERRHRLTRMSGTDQSPQPSSLGHDLVPCHDSNLSDNKPRLVDSSEMTTAIGNSAATTANSLEQSSTAILLGVCVTDEKTVSRTDQSVVKTDSVIGTLVLKDDVDQMLIVNLRNEMRNQIVSLPSSYIFVSSKGWPINCNQEKDITVKQIINESQTIRIRRSFKKPRIGVRTTEGRTLGFVFCDTICSVHQLREAITYQLGDALKQQTSEHYRFIERNGWPITLQQEHQLILVDVLIGHHICLELGDREHLSNQLKRSIPAPLHMQSSIPECSEPYSPTVPPQTPSFQLPTTTPVSQDSADSGIVSEAEWTSKKKKSRRLRPFDQLSFRTVKDVERKKVEKDIGVAKPILISYVRAESAQNALDLKKELTELGFSVYLDVHEIKTGIDWQDALNFAVSNCEVFVPLITPRYGQTQWTNREVKLADVLSKFIVPVDFTESWPPECLAIQFATTQYIQWRNQSDIDQGDGRLDTRGLDKVSCKRVAKEIAERCKIFNKRQKNQLLLTNRKSQMMRSPSEDVPQLQAINSILEVREEDEENSTKELVVISVHPKQEALAHELKTVLEDEGYNVWRSLDIYENGINSQLHHTNSNSGEILTQHYHNINRRIAESRSSSTAVSWADEVDNKIPEKLPLTSQMSLISQVNSLTPEKIEHLRKFQQKADEASVVVVVVSDAYNKSKTSQQQVYYCEHRKQVIAVKYDQSDPPCWLHMLIGNDMIKNMSSPQFMDTFKARIKRAIDPLSSSPPKDGTTEVKIQYLVSFLKKNIPLVDDSYIYIAGSSKLGNTRSEEICKAIGQKLAMSGDLHVVTGGYYGAAEIVAQNYVSMKKHKESCIFHLLPMRDSSDLSRKARQNADGSFQPVPFGKTIFLGDSIKERELAAARLFSTCILIKGGPASAHEVEQFIWNDHNVIPIISTGGAAAGMFGIPAKIFEVPAGVSQKDWSLLSQMDASPDAVADAVIKIIRCLKKACSSGSPSFDKGRTSKSKLRFIGKGPKISESQSSLFDDDTHHYGRSRNKSRIGKFMRRIVNNLKKN